jgi:ribA/ribD-fused uncharacterized protein
MARDIATISTELKSMTKTVTDISNSVEFAVGQAKDAVETARRSEKCIGELRTENYKLQSTVNDMQQKLLNLELQSRRNNLIFCGVPEQENEKWEDCENAVADILGSIGMQGVKFERVHRLGQKRQGSHRHIIAKFCYYKDKERAWKSRFDLANIEIPATNLWITEDYPPEIQKKRKALYPALRAAKRSTTVTNASLNVDKLLVDGKTYTTNNMHKLPDFLQPHNTSAIETEDVVVFFTKDAIFSNLHPTQIRVDGELFSCNEHYFQYTKAKIFDDQATAAKIKAESNPYNMMSLGKQVKGYRHQRWLQEAKGVLKRANEAKYHQNESTKAALISTGRKKLGEASANKLYGTGVGLYSKKATDTSCWTGQNMMGDILTKIRTDLLKDSSDN